MLKRKIFFRLFTLLTLCGLSFATVSCEDDEFQSLDDVALTINQTTPDTVFFGEKYSVNIIANKAENINISLSQPGSSEKVFDTTIVNTTTRYVVIKDILVPAEGNWNGDFVLKVITGSVEKTKPVHFKEAPGFPTLWVPGSHQGWDPATAPTLVSVNKDDQYEGFANFPNTNTEFKFTSHPNWDNDSYGIDDAGKLSTSGGNITVADAGYYLLKADLNDNTWSATKTNWAIIGDATGSWDNDTDMTYDAAAKVWKITKELSVGEMKFRANDGWDINFGDDGANASLEYGGANIKITTAGSYEIILDLSKAGNYTYTLKQL